MRQSSHVGVLRLVFAVCALFLGIFILCGPDANLHTASFYYVTLIPRLWPALAVLLFLSGIAMLGRKCPFGYYLSSCVYTFFALAIALAWFSGHKGNVFAPVFSIEAAAAHWVLLKSSVYDRFDPERKVGQG